MKAILEAPRQKAKGTDEVFMEALQLVPREAARALKALWGAFGRAFGRASYLPRSLRELHFFPLLKKGTHLNRNFTPNSPFESPPVSSGEIY